MVTSARSKNHENEGFSGFPKMNLKSYQSKMKQNFLRSFSAILLIIYKVKMASQTPWTPKSHFFQNFAGFGKKPSAREFPGSRFVEGCWRFPHLKIKKVSQALVFVFWFLGFKVSKFQGFKNLLGFQKIFVKSYKNPISCLLIDNDFISVVLKICLRGSSSFVGARPFEI